MIEITDQHRASIEALCRRYGVLKLEIFGSAATEKFDPERSDVDLIVEYAPNIDLGPWLKDYFELRDQLAELFGRSVDLVMAGAIRNPFFAREVNRTRKLLYAA